MPDSKLPPYDIDAEESVNGSLLIDGKTIYENLPNPFEAGRYHSLVVKMDPLPSSLVLTAETDDGVVMGIRHKDYVIEGVQFHPESIMTEVGHDVLRNFLSFSQPRWPKGVDL